MHGMIVTHCSKTSQKMQSKTNPEWQIGTLTLHCYIWPNTNDTDSQQIVAAVVKGRKSVYRKRRKMRKKSVSHIKPVRKQLIIFTNVIKCIMNYNDTNIYYLMYAGSIIKIKMQKSYAFYCVQLNVLMHARSHVLLMAFFHGSEASNTTYLRALIRSHKVVWP